MPYIHPPTIDEQILRGIAYLFTAGIGGTLLLGDLYGTLIERQLGFVALVWILFMLSGVPAAVSTILGFYRLEYVLLPCFGGALLTANVLTWFTALFVTHDVTVLPRACASSALVFLLAWRWRQINRLIKVLQWTKPPATRLA
jgi:hypothetical protein